MSEASTEDCRELRVNQLMEIKVGKEVGGKHICLPLDQFHIDGPNGKHLCFAYPVLGPRVSCVPKESENPDRDLRDITLQTVRGIATLHSHGICHGDFTPANILLRISGLDGLTENQVLEAFGEPRQNKVLTEPGETPSDPSAPKYLVEPVDFYSIDSHFMTKEACIIDFGESFEVSSPPEDFGTPQIYRSPELVLDKIAGIGSDLWALGCTFFEIRTGRKLFDNFDDSVDDHLYSIVLVLSKLPEPWWSSWEERENCFENEADGEGRAIKTVALREQDKRMDISELRSIRDALARGLLYQNNLPKHVYRDIPENEKAIFADLLGKVLRYDPKERLTAVEMQDHEWFKI